MSEPEHGVWDEIFQAKPGGVPYKDGRYATVCKVCGSDKPVHRPDCEFAALEAKLETTRIFENQPVLHMLELIAEDLDRGGTGIMRARAGWLRRFGKALATAEKGRIDD